MSQRGTQLLEIADGQISELTRLLSTRGDAILTLPCAGREKLGDGTVAACALHTADNYHRIAEFLGGQCDGQHHGERIHNRHYMVENVDLQILLERLSSASEALSILAHLTDEQLDAVPPASNMRFCDGNRTTEQVVSSMLKHQSHPSRRGDSGCRVAARPDADEPVVAAAPLLKALLSNSGVRETASRHRYASPAIG